MRSQQCTQAYQQRMLLAVHIHSQQLLSVPCLVHRYDPYEDFTEERSNVKFTGDRKCLEGLIFHGAFSFRSAVNCTWQSADLTLHSHGLRRHAGGLRS